MARGGQAPAARFVGQDRHDPSAFPALTSLWFDDLESLGYAPTSRIVRLGAIEALSVWCLERGLTQPRELTRPILEQYLRYLSRRISARTGRILSPTTQAEQLSIIKQFFKWLTHQNAILSNPASELELPRTPQRLPRYVLSHEQIEAVLGVPDTATALGLRDRALLELLYATGLRRREAALLHLGDIHFGRGLILVREGKGGKDRYAVVGERLAAWLRAYLQQSRPALVLRETPALWLSIGGLPLQPAAVTPLVKKYLQAAGIDVPGAAHLFRHAMATQMLEGGADLRYVQQMLGHAKVTTTEIYTHVSLNKLKAVYEATHPAARLKNSATLNDE